MVCNKKAIVLFVNKEQNDDKHKQKNINSFRRGLDTYYADAKIILIEWLLDSNYTPMQGRSWDKKKEFIDETIKKIEEDYEIIYIIDMLYSSRADDLLTKFLDNRLRNILIVTGTSNALENYVLEEDNIKLINKNIYQRKIENYLIVNKLNNPEYYLSYCEIRSNLICPKTMIYDLNDLENLPPLTAINYLQNLNQENFFKILKPIPENSYTFLHPILYQLMEYVNSNNQYQVVSLNHNLFKVKKDNELVGYFKIYGDKNTMLKLGGSYLKKNKVYFNPFLVVGRLLVKNKK